ncbi:MAG TPA: RNA-binding protein [Stellaceae bacterium]|nr:RNA-binding protein [Stellaceae bacterium]
MVRGRGPGGGAGVSATPIPHPAPAPAEPTAADPSPQRRCLVTGEVRDRAQLLRFVVGPDGQIVPDVAARLPGRGLWLTPRRDIVERAVAKRLFARAARRSVSAPAELADRVEGLLARRCCDSLGLARRAGLAVAGFERVREAVRRGGSGLLLCALDGAAGGRGKLAALGHGVPVVGVLTAAELGAAFGRERIVHAVVAGGPLCRRLMLDLSRLAGLRAAASDQAMDLAPARPAMQDGGAQADD